MATPDAIPTTPDTGAFVGICWVMPPSQPDDAVQAINATMQKRVVDRLDGTDALYLIETGLLLLPNQIIVTLTHGGQANLFVCDSMQVNQ